MPVTLTKAQRAALADLPTWADRRARVAALGWQGRPLTSEEWEVIEPAAPGASRTAALHAAVPELATLWADVERTRAALDAASSTWEAAVLAVRERERQAQAPEPWRPGLVNLVTSWGRPLVEGLDELRARETDALRERDRAAQDYRVAADAYHRAMQRESLAAVV